ncbi:MAG TPA: hypothetical protein VNJ52_09445 [Patescibacteria group bacterium]|nr:hypothetical protein [Patescibacteria group bacterium]
MKEEDVSVLLIGEAQRSFSHLASRLEKIGCRCEFAISYEEARHALQDGSFDLILSVAHPRDNAISSLADLLAGSPSTFFYALPVEESCWWLPALRQGERCFGAPALRPSEFSTLLDEVVAEIRSARQVKGKARIPAAKLPEKRLASIAPAHKPHP